MITTTIHLSDILNSQRIDVAYYKDNSGTNDLVPLSKYVDIKGGKRIPKGKSFSFEKTNYLYLRLSDITNLECINYSDLKNISEELFDILKRYEIRNNEIAFSIAGTIGRVFVVKNIPEGKRVILTENCAKLLPKNDGILPEYISLLLNCDFVQKQIEQNRIQTTIPKIGLDRIAKLKVPKLPSISTQQEIVRLYQETQIKSRRKEKEAQQILKSIDDYLMDVLEIDKKQIGVTHRNSEQKRISSIIGNRLDVSFYMDRFEMISTKYNNEKLASLAYIDPSISFSDYATDMPISFIPMECVDEEFGEISTLRETTISKTKGYTKFEENDLLWAKITPCMQNGKSAIARNLKNGIGCGSTEFYIIRPRSNDVLVDFIYLILRHREVLKAAQTSFGGSAGQQRVSSLYLKSIMVPVPNYSEQVTIVGKVYDMKKEAKQLQQESKTLLEETKKKIEKIIIGKLWQS